uniref:isoaspartyl peptidase/L-asparaginase n=1 Tax=uncultured Winogradskyella sp. TaxID=395353 RepID=UPI00263291E0
MKTLVPLFLILFLCFSCKKESELKIEKEDMKAKAEQPEFAIIIHGGAGTILKKNMTPEKEAAYEAKLEEAIRVGYEILKNGGSSL